MTKKKFEAVAFAVDDEGKGMVADNGVTFFVPNLLKGEKAEISALLAQYGLSPKIHFTTWDDYAIMSMVESGLGISILPKLILRRIPYHVVIKELDVPASRRICLALKDKRSASVAVKRFLDYLDYRNIDKKKA